MPTDGALKAIDTFTQHVQKAIDGSKSWSIRYILYDACRSVQIRLSQLLQSLQKRLSTSQGSQEGIRPCSEI